VPGNVVRAFSELPRQPDGTILPLRGQDHAPLDLTQMLQRVSDTIVESLGFGVAVVNLVVEGTDMFVAAVTGPPEMRSALLNRREGLDAWYDLLEASEPWGQLRFLDHAKAEIDPSDVFSWIPDVPVLDDPDAWHPEDALFAPLESSDGELLGMLSVDLPVDGKRPGPATLRALEAFSVTAALAIEHVALADQSRRGARQFEAIFDYSPVAIALLDDERNFISVNEAFCDFLHRGPNDLLGRKPEEFTHPDDRERSFAYGKAVRSRPSGRVRRPPIEKRYLLPDGSVVWARLHLAPLTTDDEPVIVIAQIEDITERKRTEAMLVRQAHFDSLTELPNRSESMRRLSDSIDADAKAGAMTAVFFCDLDRLKLVNDTHGHAVGDAYIREVSRRITASVRDSDIVGRLSGDEFIVIVPGIGSPTEAIGLAGRIVDGVRAPLQLAGERFTPSLSIGIAYSADTPTTADELLAQADSAMYRAKVEERGGWHVFDPAVRSVAAAHLALHNDLPEAVESEQFVLHYQPIVRLSDRGIVGYEALLRWQHPRLGLLSPADFLDVVLDSEYESPITDWVISQASRDAAKLPQESRRVTVNLSSVQIGRRDLPFVVRDCVEAAGLDPRNLVLELTEDRLLSRSDGAELLGSSLRRLGVSLAIDDFGTGYAGLGYLQRFHSIDIIKLDRTFIAELGTHPLSENIVRAMVDLAASSGLQLVTEGVETEDQAQLLDNLGVRYAQGYLFGRPEPLG